MKILRYHWFDIGLVLAVIIDISLFFTNHVMSDLQLILWISLISLFLHQAEEYRFPGYFPGMINSVMYKSKMPDRFPLNANTALIVNVVVGWLFYFLAAIFAEKAVWLGIATIMISLGNFFAHTFAFNIKGKTIYNPGLLTSILLFLPISIYFFYIVISGHLADTLNWVLGIVFGIAGQYLGIFKLIDIMKNENTPYPFPKRFLRPQDRS